LAGLHTRFPVHPECNARTKRGTPCKAPKVAGANRCRHHGGGRMLLRRARQTLATTRSRAVMAKMPVVSGEGAPQSNSTASEGWRTPVGAPGGGGTTGDRSSPKRCAKAGQRPIWSPGCIAPETRSGLIARRTSPVQPELSCIRCLAVSLYGYVSRHSLPNFRLTKTSALKPLRSSVCDCRRNGIPEMRTSRSHMRLPHAPCCDVPAR
jgi:hypothetical protein